MSKKNKFRLQNWDDNLYLITPKHFEHLKDGTELFSIDGKKVVKGKDKIDMDTRAGYLAFGFKIK